MPSRFSLDHMPTIAHSIVIVLVVTAGLIDVRTRRIPNVLTLGGALVALVFQVWFAGFQGLGALAAGWALGVALFLPLYLVRGLGAGDVKLLGAVGAFLGPVGVLWTALYTTLAGGVMALVVGAARGYLGRAFRNLWALLWFWRTSGIKPAPGLTIDDAPGPRLPYGIAIAAGTVATIFLR